MNMKKFMGATALVGVLASYPAGAFAKAIAAPTVADETAPVAVQDADTKADDSKAEPEILVTGSRIARSDIDSPVPVTVVTGEQLRATGNLSIGDTLNQLPQLRGTFNQANSTRFIGTAGISALDLRGLGTARTLVLVNSRRIVTATPGVNRPDVNTIPSDLIEQVDIVTGGNSAIYGSDAVAGVVNFKLKDHYQGLKVTGQGGISDRGDRGSYFVSLVAGKNFADGRGNISISGEYAKQNTLTNIDRDAQTGAFSGRSQFNATEFTGANLNPAAGALHPAEGATGNGIPDTTFLRGVLNNNISEGGLFTASCPTVAAAGESAAAFNARRAAACSGIPNPGSANTLSQFGNTFVFNSDGSLIRNPCITDLRSAGSSNCVGGLGSSLRQSGFLEPGLDRKAFNILAHFEVSPAFIPYVQGQFVQVHSNQEGQPTFNNNTFSINNPYLSTQARNTLSTVLAPGQTTFVAQRFNIDFGGRGEFHTRDTYSAVVGVKGTFFDDWKYDVSFNYGYLSTFYKTAGNVVTSRYNNSINAVRNTAGQIVCGINADASTANDDPACVPVNLFGNGAVSQEALNYFGYTSTRVQRANLYDVQGFVLGNLSKLFDLPGGPISFVLGGEFRADTAFAAYDPTTAAGLTFLNSIPDFRPPAQKVTEGFVELDLPLLKNLPFAKSLDVSLAGRVSNYNIGQTGTVYTYNANLVYAPVSDIRFRVGFGKSVRAPTQSDLYSPLTQTFLNGLVDPCAQQNINSGPNRVRNCAAAGVPTTQTFTVSGVTTTEPFSNRPASGISGFNGSNSQLNAETGYSFTAGAVIQPHWIPGLTATFDYYHVNVKNVIFSLAAQTIIDQCYDSPTGINNQYCANVFRNPDGTFAGQSNVSHGGTTVTLPTTGPSFISGPFNFARQVTSGLDADITYNRKFGNDWGINLRAIVTKTFVKYNYTIVTDPNFATRQLGLLGDPEWQGQFSANVTHGIFNFGYRMRWFGQTTVSGTYETQLSTQGRPPTNPDALPFIYYPLLTVHDLRLDINTKSGYSFYLGVDNVFDQLPPYDLQGTEAGNPISPVGRFLYVGASIKFR